MIVTKEVVASYKELLTNTQKYSLPFESITDKLIKSEVVTAKHVLAKKYIDYIDRPVSKFIIYAIMNEIWGQCRHKDENGYLGYYLQFKEASASE